MRRLDATARVPVEGAGIAPAPPRAADGGTDDHRLAAELCESVGQLLLDVRAVGLREGWPRWELMDEGDRRAHLHLMRELQRVRPADAVLSEEGIDDRRRLQHERVWIVDPLDGTSQFGIPGRSDWAVHVALVEAGALTAGAVCAPLLGVTALTAPPLVVPASREGARVRMVTSRGGAGPGVLRLARVFDAEVYTLGSVGAKALAVLTGEVDLYAHEGGLYEWDVAAPAAVAAAAGLHASGLDGSPLRYNQPSPWQPDVLICRAELAETALAAANRR